MLLSDHTKEILKIKIMKILHGLHRKNSTIANIQYFKNNSLFFS